MLGVELPDDVEGVAGFDALLESVEGLEPLPLSELDEEDESEELADESVLVLAAVEVELPPRLSFL